MLDFFTLHPPPSTLHPSSQQGCVIQQPVAQLRGGVHHQLLLAPDHCLPPLPAQLLQVAAVLSSGGEPPTSFFSPLPIPSRTCRHSSSRSRRSSALSSFGSTSCSVFFSTSTASRYSSVPSSCAVRPTNSSLIFFILANCVTEI